MRNHTSKRAFTIVELLTVMGVIAMLIGLLVPALQVVRRIAKDTRQRAQFHSISVALEIFKNDENEYPDSSEVGPAANLTTGSQKLAEALIGRDMQGFDPLTSWDAYTDDTSTKIYASTDKGSSTDEIDDSMARRKGPYLKLENVGAFNIDQIYPKPAGVTDIFGFTATPPATGSKPAPLITDVFADRQITLTLTSSTGTAIQRTVKAGTPLLYYRANASYKNLGKGASTPLNERTYNYYDNHHLLAMGRMMNNDPTNTAFEHKMYDSAVGGPTVTSGAAKFYDTISNPQISLPAGVAYNADSFLLMSAGKDGFFGTADDVYNFGE